MAPEKLRKRRIAAVRAVLKEKNLPDDMRRHCMRVLQLLHGWSVINKPS